MWTSVKDKLYYSLSSLKNPTCKWNLCLLNKDVVGKIITYPFSNSSSCSHSCKHYVKFSHFSCPAKLISISCLPSTYNPPLLCPFGFPALYCCISPLPPTDLPHFLPLLLRQLLALCNSFVIQCEASPRPWEGPLRPPQCLKHESHEKTHQLPWPSVPHQVWQEEDGESKEWEAAGVGSNILHSDQKGRDEERGGDRQVGATEVHTAIINLDALSSTQILIM